MSIRLCRTTLTLCVLISITAAPAQAGGLICWAIGQESRRLADQFKSLDSNDDGQLSSTEYLNKEAHCIPGLGNKKTFSILDSNKDRQLSTREYSALPWHVVGRHCELDHSPFPVASREENVEKYDDAIDKTTLKLAPPLTGNVYDRSSGHVIDALLTISMRTVHNEKVKTLGVKPNSRTAALDADGNGELTQHECWQFLYTHNPVTKTVGIKSP